jgi:hypothetical protein
VCIYPLEPRGKMRDAINLQRIQRGLDPLPEEPLHASPEAPRTPSQRPPRPSLKIRLHTAIGAVLRFVTAYAIAMLAIRLALDPQVSLLDLTPSALVAVAVAILVLAAHASRHP